MKSRFYALATAVISLLLVGCSGSTSSPGTVQAAGGYSNATVTGTYAIALSGIEPMSGPFYNFGIMATLASTGTGQFTGTYTEHVQLLNTNLTGNPQCPGTISGGTYSITTTGIGTASMTFSPSSPSAICTTLSAVFVIATNSTGGEIVLTEEDGTAESSGTGIQQ